MSDPILNSYKDPDLVIAPNLSCIHALKFRQVFLWDWPAHLPDLEWACKKQGCRLFPAPQRVCTLRYPWEFLLPKHSTTNSSPTTLQTAGSWDALTSPLLPCWDSFWSLHDKLWAHCVPSIAQSWLLWLSSLTALSLWAPEVCSLILPSVVQGV